MKRLLLLALGLCAAQPAQATADPDNDDVPLTPATLGDALSCRSREGLEAFAGTLFLDGKAPAWMRALKEDKQTEGMLGLYGYRLSQPATLLGEPVDRVYFLQNWIVTLWPRAKAQAFIAAHKMARAPIEATEQYYRFIDPDSGPMLGAFEPTGNATAAMLAQAFGGTPPPAVPSDSLFVGCNYTVASQAEFLAAARQSGAVLDQAAKDLGKAAVPRKP
jgi:hypothetical protein